MEVIKVSANSRTAAVAGAIAGVVRDHHQAIVQAIGAGSVNQAVKALVLATGYLKGDGIQVTCVPEFVDVTIQDQVRTAIRLVISPTANSDFSSISPHTMDAEMNDGRNETKEEASSSRAG